MLRMNKQYNKLYNIFFKVKIQRKQFQKLLFFIFGIWEVSFCLDDVNNFLVFILIIFIAMLIRAFSLANLINKIKIDVIVQKYRQGGQGWVLKCAVSKSQNLTNSLSLNLSFSLPTPLLFWLGISHSFASPGFSVAQPCRAHCFLRVSMWSVPRISAAWDSHSLAQGSTGPHSEETGVQCGLLQLFPKTLCEHCCWENPWGRREECSEVPPAPGCISFACYWLFLFFLCRTISSLLLSSFFFF